MALIPLSPDVSAHTTWRNPAPISAPVREEEAPTTLPEEYVTGASVVAEQIDEQDEFTNARRRERPEGKSQRPEIAIKVRGDIGSRPVEEEQIARHDVIVREVHGDTAHIAISTDKGPRSYAVKIDGMVSLGAGRVNAGDQFTLQIVRASGGYKSRFVRKPQSAVIPFQEPISDLDQDYIRFKLQKLQGPDGSAE